MRLTIHTYTHKHTHTHTHTHTTSGIRSGVGNGGITKQGRRLASSYYQPCNMQCCLKSEEDYPLGFKTGGPEPEIVWSKTGWLTLLGIDLPSSLPGSDATGDKQNRCHGPLKLSPGSPRTLYPDKNDKTKTTVAYILG